MTVFWFTPPTVPTCPFCGVTPDKVADVPPASRQACGRRRQAEFGFWETPTYLATSGSLGETTLNGQDNSIAR